MTSTKKTISTLFTLLLMSGCSSLTLEDSFNESLKNMDIDNNSTVKLDGAEMTNLRDKIKNIEFDNDHFVISYSITLKDALRKLANIDKRKYHLHQDMENLLLPASTIKIYSFLDLKYYIEDVLEKSIYISKNAIINNRMKIVKIRDIGAKINDISKIDFKISSDTEMSAKDALSLLSLSDKFDFSINIDNEDFEVAQKESIFNDILLNFKGDNVATFFKYLEKKLNIFVEIDYQHKIINLKKYSKKTFALTISNLEIKVNENNTQTKVTSDGTDTSGGIVENKEINIYKELEESFSKIIEEAKKRGNENSYYILDENTGTIVVYADKKTLKSFAELINETNNSYKDMIEVELLTFEIIFSKSYLLQTDIQSAITDIGSINGVKDVVNTSFTNILADRERKTKYMFESLSEYGYVTNKKNNTFLLRNNIPDGSTKVQNERYLKNLVTIDPAVDGDVVKQSTETDIINQPNNYNITAHYLNGHISIDIKTSRGELTKMETLGEEGYLVSNPHTTSTIDTIHAYIKDGETFVSASELQSKKSSSWNGLVPTEWLAANLIGGGKDDINMYSQQITIITAKKINNL